MKTISRRKHPSFRAQKASTKKLYQQDKQNFENYINNKTTTLDYRSYARLLFSNLSYDGKVIETKLSGFTQDEIANMVAKPENYTKQLVSLSQYMYRKSGYYQRLINYYVDMALYCWTVDTVITDIKFLSVDQNKLKTNLYKYIGEIVKLNLESELPKILKRVYLEDICYGFLVEGDSSTESFIYYLPSDKCAIKTITDGIYGFGISTRAYSKTELEKLPVDIQTLINSAGKEQYAIVPPEKSICLKYNSDVTYAYPPLFSLIGSILSIDDYKSLEKSKSEGDNYKLLNLEIPINSDNHDDLLLTDAVTVPFTNMTRDILPKEFGVIPTPFKVTPIQFKSDNSERNKVKDSIDQFYGESGVSQDLLASSSSGSTLKISIENDASDLYRIYRQIEQVVNLKMKLLGYVYPTHLFKFTLLNVNVYNQNDCVDKELKLAQTSVPNKMKLCATSGINPAKLLGNEHIENTVLSLGSSWTVLNTSYTQSSASAGAPLKDESDLSDSGTISREKDSNLKDNRM